MSCSKTINRALINASSGIVQKPLRYVLYVRKSSEDAEAQAKSLPDQIADCKEYANNHGLLLVGEPIQESKSAKKSGNRPLFSQMLKDIEKGKYDAILAWHPDRLSRNSLEAGMVVNMVDNGVIKDLRFPTFEFHNDSSSGKLTLNMLFALSKQYSEHLSESAQRGASIPTSNKANPTVCRSEAILETTYPAITSQAKTSKWLANDPKRRIANGSLPLLEDE